MFLYTPHLTIYHWYHRKSNYYMVKTVNQPAVFSLVGTAGQIHRPPTIQQLSCVRMASIFLGVALLSKKLFLPLISIGLPYLSRVSLSSPPRRFLYCIFDSPRIHLSAGIWNPDLSHRSDGARPELQVRFVRRTLVDFWSIFTPDLCWCFVSAHVFFSVPDGSWWDLAHTDSRRWVSFVGSPSGYFCLSCWGSIFA
jgi:hypothetical protein